MNRTTKAKCWTYLIGFVFTIFLVCIDQLTKYLAVIHLKGQPPIRIIPGVFEFQYLENRGAAFGILQGKKYLLVLITLLILAVILYVYMKTPLEKKYRPLRWILIFVMASAFGNMIDRILHDYVIDFLYFCLINFPIFNIADCYVVVAAIVFVFLFFFYYKEEDFSFLYPKRTTDSQS